MEGMLSLSIEPGRFDTVAVDSEGVLQDSVAKGFLAGLRSGDIIRTRDLETALLNLRDVPGIVSNASLSPGATQGTSNLNVKIDHHDRDSYVLYTENYGSRAAGRYRYGL